jgi:hypothetical protein
MAQKNPDGNRAARVFVFSHPAAGRPDPGRARLKFFPPFADNPSVNKWRLAARKGQPGNRRMPAKKIRHATGMSCNQRTPQGVTQGKS